MIGTIDVRCNAAKPNFPLQPMFAFMGSPSSIRVLDVPKSIGSWEITSVRVAVLYPNNLTIEKVAVRTGSVWVATIEGCEVAGKVGNGYQILADGKDEDGNDVTGYVLGKGDVFILDNDSDVKKLLEKYTVRYLDEVPAAPSVGDLLNINGQIRLFDGERWLYISNGGEPTVVYDSEIKIKENGTEVGSFTTNSEMPVDIDIPVPSRTSDLVNDSGFITASAIPSNVSEFNNDAGYLTAASTTITQLDGARNDHELRIREVEKQATGARDWMDLTYPTVNASASDGFGIASFTIAFPSYDGKSSATSVLDLFSVQSGMAKWEGIPNLLVRSSDGKHFYHNQGLTGVEEFPLNNTSPTKVWMFYDAGGIRPAYITASFKSNTMKKIALEDYVNAQISSAVPSNVSELNNDVGYLTASSSAFVAKRDKTDMSAVVGTTYASWNLSALHSATYSPALELKWGTYNVFGQQQGCWLVDDEYRQLCFFLMPELNMLYWGVRNQDGSYIAGYGETITLSSDELSIATINGVAEITCTRTSKEGSPEVSTIATMKDLRGFQNINEKRDWWDNTTPASVDATGKFTINTFSVMVGSSSYVLDQFSKSGSTSTWKTTSGDYPNITTTDGLNFTLNYDSSTIANFTMSDLKPGPAKGIIGGSNFNIYANFKLTTFALKDYVDAQIGSINTALDNINGEVI